LRGPQRPRRGAELQQVQSISDGALLIRNGVCAEVGPSRRVENLTAARRANVIVATGRVVIPGFVDCHVHPFSAAPWSGDADGTARELLSVTWKRHAARVRTLMHAMIRHGTTAAQVLTTGSRDSRVESKVLRVFEALRDEPLDLSEELLLELDPSTSPAALESVLRRYLVGREAPAVGLTWNPEELAPEELMRQLRVAGRTGVSLHLHAHGAAAATAIRAAAEMPVAEIGHLEEAPASMAAALAATGTIATLTPGSYFSDKARLAPARAFIEAGVPVALASGYRPGTGSSLNMQTAMAMAAMVLGMSPEEALTAATFNAACAAGCADTCGSLETGKSADLLILNISDYRELSQHLGINQVHCTVRRGEVVYREGAVSFGSAVNGAARDE
jgi:imidazolonepropionase